MGTTLENGIYLPDEGERNCYDGLAGNWVALDNHLGSTNIHVTINDKQAWDGHVADTTIHVTSADKQAWNGKADASALTAHTGDTTIHVTAEDKAKWDAVTGKANDADVVHTSGNETISGFKQFANIRATNSIKAINLENTTIDLNNCYSDFAPRSENKGGNIQYYYCNTDAGTANISNLPEAKAFVLTSITTRLISTFLYVKQILINSNSKTFVRYCNNSTWSSWVNETDSEYVHKSGNETISGNKTFSSINGVEPSSLSLPSDRSARVDISGYFTNMASGYTNTYTAPSNGWIYLALNDVTAVNLASQTSGGLTNYGDYRSRSSNGAILCLFPIRSGDVFVAQWYTTTTVTVTNAYFIPCQGNV